MAELEMSPQLFTIFSSFIEERIGISYDPPERELLLYKLASRATEAGFYSLLDYYYHLRYDDPDGTALAALTDALVINETFFFRERRALERLIEIHVAPLCARKQRPRIWCAAASTGEEPFSLAMLLAERGLLDQVDILATDISQRALTRARRGVHVRRSLREGYPPDLAAKYLQIDGETIRVAPDLLAAVNFQCVNLLDQDAVAKLGMFDVILCRNVFIYFRDERTQQIVRQLAAALNLGGVLLVGVSESLLRFGTVLSCEERGGAFFYRKEG